MVDYQAIPEEYRDDTYAYALLIVDRAIESCKKVYDDLPRGTKIWPSVQKLMDSLPRYANGTKFDDTNISRIDNLFSSSSSGNSNSGLLAAKLDQVISLLGNLLVKENNWSFEGIVQLDNKRQVGKWLAPAINNIESSYQKIQNIKEGK